MVAGSPGQPTGGLTGLAAGSTLGGFLIESRLGAGGMAVVFRARDEGLDRTVALKVLAPALAEDAEFRERFIRESRAAARVDHPHIIPVHAAGETDGVLYLAMRLVPGGDLRSLINREGPLTGERAAFLLSPIASALDAAHAAGLVHRDVKSANILIDTSPGRPDHPYLSDFGLAKSTVSSVSLTETGQFLGTPDYAAPEQISGRPLGPRTDQYALACVAYTMLTGSLPFARGSSMAVLWAQMYDAPPSVSTRRRDLPPAVDGVLGRALSKVPGERFGTCLEFTNALRAALGVAAYAGSRPGTANVGRAAASDAGTGQEPPTVPPAPPPTKTAAPHLSTSPTSALAPPQWRLPSAPAPLRVSPAAGPRSPVSRSPGSSRRQLMQRGGVAAGVAAAAAVIAIVLVSSGNPPSNSTASHDPATQSPATRSPAPSRPAVTPTATYESLLTGGQSGLSYAQLPAPWQGASCPSTLDNGAFTWTDGEYAVAGQVKGGTETWYGEACSGPLPQQYGYTSSAQLQTTAVNLAQTFQNAYYGDLNHTVTQEDSQPVQVSGHVGWKVTYDVVYTDQADQGETWSDEQAAVVVVDNGTHQPAVFFTSIPSNLNDGNVTALVHSLQLG
jgi:serine/threonine protein kinase